MSFDIKSERDKAYLNVLLTSIHSRTESLMTMGAIAAALLVVATFKKSDLSTETKWLLSILLFTIGFSVVFFWLRREYDALDSSRKLDLDQNKHPLLDEPLLRWIAGGAHFFAGILVTIFLVWMFYFIWAD